jgi:predicted GNAT family N-acyltransferase
MKQDRVVRFACWDEDWELIKDIRHSVFVVEQSVPLELEWDGSDQECKHVIALERGRCIGTGRISSSGHIGRMAVDRRCRDQGVGRSILMALIKHARGQLTLTSVSLNAQISAVGFYKKQDFYRVGDEFFDAGIMHIRMICDL